MSSLAEVAVSWFLQVNRRCQQKDSFIQLLVLTAASMLTGVGKKKKNPYESVNLIYVAVELQDAGVWHKGGGGNKCLGMKKGFLQQLEFLLL